MNMTTLGLRVMIVDTVTFTGRALGVRLSTETPFSLLLL
jgi:hypothetical protein